MVGTVGEGCRDKDTARHIKVLASFVDCFVVTKVNRLGNSKCPTAPD